MPFGNYEELCDTVLQWIDRDEEDLDRIQDMVWLAECEIQGRIEFRLEDKIKTDTSIAGQEYIQLPQDYQGGGVIRWDDPTQPAIEVSTMDRVDFALKLPPASSRAGAVNMQVGAIWGERLYIGPVADEGIYHFFYKAGIQHLGKDMATNTLLREYPGTLHYGALVQSAPFFGQDHRMELWERLYNKAIQTAEAKEEKARNSHGPLRQRVDHVVT